MPASGMTAWSRTWSLMACAGMTLAFADVSVDRRAPWPVSLSLSLLTAVALFVALAGRPPRVRLPRRARIPAVVAKASFLAARSAGEEVIWRWFVLGGLAPVVGALPALAASTAGFAIAHHRSQGTRGVLVHVLTGAAFGCVFLATGSLVAAVTAHVAYNLLVLTAVEAESAVRKPPRRLLAASTVDGSGAQPDCPAELVAVSKSFGAVAALRDVSLRIDAGEIVALLGPNGAGKTTAINVLLGLRRPDRGHARLFGIDPRALEARREIGATPQESAFPPTLRVNEVVELVGAHYASPTNAATLLSRFGLADVATRQVGGLSTGQRRRLAVALAFVGRARAIFLDEPTTGLDVVSRRSVWDAIRQFAADGGGVLITTHDLGEAEALATRVVVVSGGRVVAQGSVREIAAGSGLIQVRVPHQPLPALGAVVRAARERDGLALYTHDAEAVVRQLVGAGASLEGLEVRRLALEEAFLALVGESA